MSDRSRELVAQAVEQHVAAWGDFRSLTEEVLPQNGEHERHYAAPLPLRSAEIDDLAKELGLDDLLVRPGDIIGQEFFRDWWACLDSNPNIQWSLGKMGVIHAYSMTVPAEPSVVHVMSSCLDVNPHSAPERFLGLSMLYFKGSKHLQQTVGVISQPDGRAEAVRFMNFSVAGTPLHIYPERRESSPKQTRVFIGRMREIIHSPYFRG